MSYLIIGVDPGHTIGLAALDLSGRPIRTAHIQQGGFGAALAELETWGNPSLVASDVRPAPELVLKLASAFNAALFVPERPWREDDKRTAAAQMLEQFSLSVQNVHERDALSAAVQAWRHHQNTLRFGAQPGITAEELDILRHLLLQGIRQTAAMEMVIKLRSPPQKEEGRAPANLPSAPSVRKSDSSLPSLSQERVISELRKRISFLEAERETFLHRIRLLENGVAGARMADWERQKMAARISLLQTQLDLIYGRKKKNKQQTNQPRQALPSPKRISPSPASAPSVSAHSSSLSSKSAAIIPNEAETDLKKLNALRLSKMIEEYRRTRVSSQTSR